MSDKLRYTDRIVGCCQGMTLVEVMVAMAIVAIISGVVWNVSLIQSRSADKSTSVLQSAGSAKSALELIKRDLFRAGYGVLDLHSQTHQKNMAFFIQDGGTGASDKLYLFDGSYIDLTELRYDLFAELGYANIKTNTGTAVTLDRLDLDSRLSSRDNKYGSSSNPNEFAGNIWQTIITNSDTAGSKIAKISSIIGKTLNLDRTVTGSKVGPAVYYCVDWDGNDTSCHPAGGNIPVLRRSSRTSGGRQPVSENIVDMQVVYKSGSNLYGCGNLYDCSTGDPPSGFTCNGGGMNPFIPGSIDMVRISLVSFSGVSESATPTVQVANGRTWGGANDQDANGNYRNYKIHTISVHPRNNIEL